MTARGQLKAELQPQPMQLRRLVIAEAITLPALGHAFYELGPGRTITELAHAFQRLAQRGVLHITHPLRAASDFNWLLMSDPLNRAMFLGENEPPEPASIDAWAKEAVHTFLAAYNPRPSPGAPQSRGRRR